MKKNIRKLAVRSETLRTLRPLHARELEQAIGGDVPRLAESGDLCPAHAVVVVSGTCA